jgi:PAS domain S-box-containing protein
MNHPPRILIVEDECLIAFDLSRRLPRLGYEVCDTVATGEDAVARAAALQPDLVLMDICLEGKMDGIEAANLIRQHQRVPVVYLTANSDEKTLLRAKASHPATYLLKPFKERELQIGIDMALHNHRLRQELEEAREHLEQRVAERTDELARVNDALRAEAEVRKRMEAQAREQADFLCKARDAIYVRDLDGVISYWNCSAARLYGVPPDEAIGQPAAALLGEAGGVDAAAAEHATREAGEWTGELSQRCRDGRELVVESRWTLMRGDDGEPRTILVVNTDITERKQIGEQFLRAQRLESVGALASGIAHDLNNVFAPILMAAELLRDAPEGSRERIIEMIALPAQRGTGMVRQLLMFVRGGDGVMHPVPLAHLAEEIRGLMRETLPPSIRVAGDIDAGAGLVLGDPTQLHQVLLNLCVNARDAMPDGGELRIELAEAEVGEARARRHEGIAPGRYVRLAVADTGTGMPPEVQAKIFEPFFTTKGEGKGTGLGLSTVIGIVRAHRGFVEVESEPGRGSRFHVYLPPCDSAPAEAEVEAPAPPRGRGELLIVADDERSLREVARLTLELHNYRVLLASDGAEALSAYLQHRGEVALVVTDVLMPIMNGRALIHALRKLDPTLPVLAFSAAEADDPMVAVLAEEGVAHVRKPAPPARFLEAVATAVGSGGARRRRSESADVLVTI